MLENRRSFDHKIQSTSTNAYFMLRARTIRYKALQSGELV